MARFAIIRKSNSLQYREYGVGLLTHGTFHTICQRIDRKHGRKPYYGTIANTQLLLRSNGNHLLCCPPHSIGMAVSDGVFLRRRLPGRRAPLWTTLHRSLVPKILPCYSDHMEPQNHVGLVFGKWSKPFPSQVPRDRLRGSMSHALKGPGSQSHWRKDLSGALGIP